MRLKTICESKHKVWIDPDVIYQEPEATTFMYTEATGLLTDSGNIPHATLLYNATRDRNTPNHDYVIWLLRQFQDNYNTAFLPVAIVGRASSTELLQDVIENKPRCDRYSRQMESARDIIDAAIDGSFVTLWRTNELLPQCMLALYDKAIINDPVCISCPETGTDIWRGQLQAIKPTDTPAASQTQIDLQKELHNLRGDDKRAAMLKLGLNPYSKKHEWTAALQKANIVGPGQDWWRMQSEGVESPTKISAPTITKILRNPAAIYIQFPSGSTWEYVIYDNRTLDDLLNSHRRNIGRLVATLKRMGVEANQI